MSTINSVGPRRGEIWLVDFNPTRGAEIQKQRPAIVVSSNAVGRLPIKLVAPITGWNPAFVTPLSRMLVRPLQTLASSKLVANLGEIWVGSLSLHVFWLLSASIGSFCVMCILSNAAQATNADAWSAAEAASGA